MDIFIIIIFAIIVCPLLGTLFGILLTLYKTGNVNLKIGLLIFVRPLFYTILLELLFPSIFNNSIIWLSCFFAAVLFRDIINDDLKFLSKLAFFDGHISIEYINALLKRKSIDLPLDSIKELKLSKMVSIAYYPASLRFSENDEEQRFIIFNKEIWSSANVALNAVNSGLPEAGPTNMG